MVREKLSPPMPFRAVLLALALSPLAVRAQSANVVAGLQQDVSSLRDEVKAAARGSGRPEGGPGGRRRPALPQRKRMRGEPTPARSPRESPPSSPPRRPRAKATAPRRTGGNWTRSSRAWTRLSPNRPGKVNEALRAGAGRGPSRARNRRREETKTAGTPADMPKTGVRYTVQAGELRPAHREKAKLQGDVDPRRERFQVERRPEGVRRDLHPAGGRRPGRRRRREIGRDEDAVFS